MEGCNLNEISKKKNNSCPVANKLWIDVLSWLGISCVSTNESFCHAMQFIGLISRGKQLSKQISTFYHVIMWFSEI